MAAAHCTVAIVQITLPVLWLHSGKKNKSHKSAIFFVSSNPPVTRPTGTKSLAFS